MRLFIFGLGFSARAFIRLHGSQFAALAGTYRSKSGVVGSEQPLSIEMFSFTGTEMADPAISDWLAKADGVLVSVPPGPEGCPALRAFGPQIAAARNIRWIGYLSTVGVYGDHGGAWVDETSALATRNARSLLRIEAEKSWTALATSAGHALDILRLPGIYGPGRNALVDLAAGRARRIARQGQVFNRIHVDDIAATLAALTGRAAGKTAAHHVGIYNVSDDEPAPQADVITYAAGLLGIAPPPETTLEEAGLSPMGLSFWTENKRIANTRLKTELGISLAYPDYRTGLDALLAAGEGRATPS
ncbi:MULTISPECIES: NAD(P)-dependent oxidoreductase [unclassified Chelatococcus]|uniref:NAD(P)-dependent oxidoreductase n=1 Tax=unclassified Chelatococcus TaxID=2638111 RepID=UPI001BD11CFA|nr:MULTISPECIES: NAD(P)-dependent oxidoreductase [unclassified Chelatococcus]CAH1661629.1 Nucleoside-diphosphate-sugar epimerase [Hyphomicrobiales bacterium]MBS7741285.1 NAD(P)-dependent oxidoreductase [Chelatococcus sp. HY11]MBX3546233.1 NAD(P)-dependent oxidoreductase [Chelatococcus sp.]MCO5078108.1 NAD(P)-dependent oxidoreductase [Chelatococcus sp.]CAH1683036.1 Nucleoside-diphosphate-sugar epimerase [Hyphomicrobiales bacterium]